MPKRPDLAPTSISISLGGGASLSITTDDHLIVEDVFVRFSLGPVSVKRIEEIQSYLERLKVHAPDA